MASWSLLLEAKGSLLLIKLWQQIYLATSAVLIAVLISIPIAILIIPKKNLRRCVLAFSSILQTLPSLAMFGFLLPFFGIGMTTALITLVLYAVLPIISNTVTGLMNLSPHYLETADSLGLTKWQKLRHVEAPLALPTILTGIRTATVMCVGIATLAAFIGAGGLGDFIYEGITLNNTKLILLGAIPAALLALLFDSLIARIKNLMQFLIAGILVIVVFASGVIYSEMHSNNQVRIATKNFTEQLILGELLAQLIQKDSTIQVVRKFNLGSSMICHQALVRGDIDIYPEYSGTSYSIILHQTAPKNSQDTLHYLQEVYPKKFKANWGNSLGFSNSNAIAVSGQLAAKHHLKTISDLRSIASKLIIGVPADFLERPDGFNGLKQAYHINFAEVKLMEPGLMYKAIQANNVAVIMAYSTDARIAKYNLVLLRDDLKLFPAYLASPVISDALLEQHPEIKTILSRLEGRLTDQLMRRLNYQVEVLKIPPEEVAKKFLMAAGI